MNILISILNLVSKLPLKILYIFSDIMFFLNYYFVGYRKEVITQNLKNSFPEKSDKEIPDQKKVLQEFF